MNTVVWMHNNGDWESTTLGEALELVRQGKARELTMTETAHYTEDNLRSFTLLPPNYSIASELKADEWDAEWANQQSQAKLPVK